MEASSTAWFDQLEGKFSKERQSLFIQRGVDFGKDFTQDLLEEIDISKRGKKTAMPCMAPGRYYTELKPYYDLFPKEQILILKSEEFFSDPIPVLQTIEDFVGIQHHDWSKEHFEPKNKGEYSKEIPDEALSLPTSFYFQEVRDLESLTGLKFDWF